MQVQLALTGPPARACFARTGWDTCQALLAQLALITLKLLLNTTRLYQILWNIQEQSRKNGS